MLTADEVLDVVCDAVLEANRIYFDMSGGMNLQNSGIEPFVSSLIAQRFYEAGHQKDGVSYATMENTYSQIFDWSKAKKTPGVKPEVLRGQGRIDVVIYNKREGPVGLIEVKRHFGWSLMQSDVERMMLILERCGPKKAGSLRWGCVAGFHTNWSTTKKDVETRHGDFKSMFTEFYPEMKLKSRFKKESAGNQVDSEGSVVSDFYAIVALFKNKK